MPLYQIRCSECKNVTQMWRKVEERDHIPFCDICRGQQQREIVAPTIRPDITPYRSPGSGKMITSRVEMNEDLLKTGSIINEPGLKADIARRKTEIDEATFAPIAAAVDAQVSALVNTRQIES